MITMILACNKNGTIGYKNRIPWILKNDLKNFKEITVGTNVLMGRKTFDSIGAKPLPDRNNFVITSLEWYYKKHMDSKENLHFVCDVEQVPEHFTVIGGKRLYEHFINYATVIHLTAVNDNFVGDVILENDFFTTLYDNFDSVSETNYFADKNNTHDFKTITFTRKNAEPALHKVMNQV